jgi:ABC-type transport system involved in multi-copper enzyme maturation permease subunit
MNLKCKQFFSISVLTALETTRQPICLLLSITGILFTALLPFITTHTFDDAGKLILDSALALQLVVGLLLGSIAACSSLTREIRTGTVAAILSKPVGRNTFFLAKYSGIAGVVLLYQFIATLTTLLAVRTASQTWGFDWWAALPLLLSLPLALALSAAYNYLSRRPFISSAYGLLLVSTMLAFCCSAFVNRDGTLVPFGSSMTWEIIPAALLVACANLLLCGITVSLATRMSTVPTLATTLAIFLLGLMSDYLFGRQAATHQVAAWFYSLTPNWQIFWTADALSGPGFIPWHYVQQAGLYMIMYLAGVLCLGMISFQQIDINA